MKVWKYFRLAGWLYFLTQVKVKIRVTVWTWSVFAFRYHGTKQQLKPQTEPEEKMSWCKRSSLVARTESFYLIWILGIDWMSCNVLLRNAGSIWLYSRYINLLSCHLFAVYRPESQHRLIKLLTKCDAALFLCAVRIHTHMLHHIVFLLLLRRRIGLKHLISPLVNLLLYPHPPCFQDTLLSATSRHL